MGLTGALVGGLLVVRAAGAVESMRCPSVAPKPIIFKHFHKSGGTTFYGIARKNVRVYKPFDHSHEMNGNMDEETSPGCGTRNATRFDCPRCAATLANQSIDLVATEFNTFHAVNAATYCGPPGRRRRLRCHPNLNREARRDANTNTHPPLARA